MRLTLVLFILPTIIAAQKNFSMRIVVDEFTNDTTYQSIKFLYGVGGKSEMTYILGFGEGYSMLRTDIKGHDLIIPMEGDKMLFKLSDGTVITLTAGWVSDHTTTDDYQWKVTTVFMLNDEQIIAFSKAPLVKIR